MTPSREVLLMLARSYEEAKGIGPFRDERSADPFEISEPYTARQRGTDARHGLMQNIHTIWQELHRTDELGIYVDPEGQIDGPFLEFVQVLWAEAGFDAPPARTVRKIITGF